MADEPITSGDLTDLLKGITDLVDTMREMNEGIEQDTKQRLDYSRWSKQAIGFRLARVNVILKDVYDVFLQGLRTSEQLQIRSLAVNRDLTDSVWANSKELRALPGGLETAMDVRISQLESGLIGYNQNLTKLGVEQKLTGQDFKKAILTFRQLDLVGGLLPSEMSVLSKSIMDSSDKYGVQTDQLVDAISNLQGDLVRLRALGATGGLTTAVAELTAQLGAESGSLVADAVKFLTGTNAQDMVRASMLGIQDIRRQLAGPGATTEDLRKAIIEGGERTQSLIDSFAAGGFDPAFQLGVLEDILGTEAFYLAALSEELQNQTKIGNKELEINREFNRSWTAFKQEMVQPVFTAIMHGFTVGLDILTGLKTTVRNMLAFFIAQATANQIDRKLGLVATAFIAKRFIPVAGWIGIIAGLVPDAIRFFKSQEQKSLQEQAKASMEAAEARIRERQQTNRFLQLHSDSLKASLDGIMLSTGIQSELARLNQDQLDGILQLVGEMRRANEKLQDVSNGAVGVINR